MKKWLILLLLLIVLVVPTPVRAADPTVHITVTALVVGTPSGLIIEYVNDYEVILSWTPGAGAIQTMVRSAIGHLPTDITDGNLVYVGAGATCTDDAMSLASPDITYYQLWSQDGTGAWSAVGLSGSTEDLMSASFLFIGLLLLMIFLTWFAWKTKHIIVSMAASMAWWGMGLYMFFATTPVLGMGESWQQILVWVFFMVGFVPILLQMNTESRRETKDKYGNVWSWTEHNESRPSISKSGPPNDYETYREELQKRLRGATRRR